jgi:hypothetical protein
MLSRIVNGVWRRLVDPRLPRRGWRPARATPADDLYLQASFGYDDEDAIKSAVVRVRHNTLTTFERLASLWQQVRYLDRFGVDGCLVECGVWRGGSLGLMALAHAASGRPTRRLHAFDSFQGLPEPRAELDGAEAIAYSRGRASGALEPIGAFAADVALVRAFVEGELGYPADLFRPHVGWFQDTVPAAAHALGDIALLRLDGDWYESTRICLEHLYPRVVKGGVVVIDDYGHWSGCKRAVDEMLEAWNQPVLLHHVDYTARCWLRAF